MVHLPGKEKITEYPLALKLRTKTKHHNEIRNKNQSEIRNYCDILLLLLKT